MQDGTLAGYLPQRRNVVPILLKYYFDIQVAPPPSPWDFALCCWDICVYTKKLIASDYVTRRLKDHLEKLDKETNLTAADLEHLKTYHDKCFPDNTWNDEGNHRLRDYLNKREAPLPAFIAELAQKFCEDTTPFIKEQLQKLFPDIKLVFGPPKTVDRIRQKLDEYANTSLHQGVHVFKQFRDLYRASIAYEDYTRNKLQLPPNIFVSHIKERADGNYRACYVTLNICSLNVELKIVRSLAPIDQSHDWYELKRHNSKENLRNFICHGIEKLAKVSLADAK